MTDAYLHIEASLLRFCRQFANRYNLEALNMDNFTDEAQWPEGDFTGFGEFNLEVTEFYEGQCVFMISTRDDTNLFRMRNYISKLMDELLPTKSIEVVNADTGDFIGRLRIQSGTRVGAPVLTKTQPIKPIMIGFTSDITPDL